MSKIFSIMKEEHQRLLAAEKVYQRNIRNLPQGALRIKHMGKRDYLYLVRRQGQQVVYNYVGAVGSDKARNVIREVNRRRQLAGLLKDVRLSLKDVKRVLRGKI